MAKLEPSVGDYFAGDGTVERWWTPDTGPLSFHYDAEITILEDHLKVDPSWRVLDVGTGRGRFGTFFAQKGCNVVGLDLSSEMLEQAAELVRQKGLSERFRLQEGNAEDLSSFADAEFDVVLCMELFDHLPDLQRALREMRRTLKPGGHFLFTYVPNESIYGGLGNLYRWLRRRMSPSESMISRTYTLREIRRQLAESGLTLERYWGVGLLCINAQTRLFVDNLVVRGLTALARAEARRWPYYESPLLARHGAHVVGLGRSAP